MEARLEFKVNDLITLKLEEGKTVIYVAGKEFKQCKYLLMVNPEEIIGEEVDSIDEAAERYDTALEREITPEELGITPEEEFRAHCSNLHAWAEHGYDTRLLHSNLAFPLLARLGKEGDTAAKEMYAEEFAVRFDGASKTVQKMLRDRFFYELHPKQALTIIRKLESMEHDFSQGAFGSHDFAIEGILGGLEDRWSRFDLYEDSDEMGAILKEEVARAFTEGSRGISARFISSYTFREHTGDEELFLFTKEEILDLYESFLCESDLKALKALYDEARYFARFYYRDHFDVKDGKIISLRLEGNWFDSFPRAVLGFKHLRRLKVSDYLTITLEIPDWLGGLSWLEELEIRGRFKSLPEGLGNLTSLKKLIIAESRPFGQKRWEPREGLSALPDSLGNLTGLEYLYLGMHYFTEVPPFIGRLKALKHLEIGGNPIAELPESLWDLEQLEVLNIGGMNLTVLSESVGKLKNLKSLVLGGNKLKSIPRSIASLPLVKINIEDLPLEEFPMFLFGIPTIEYIFAGRVKAELPPCPYGFEKRDGLYSKINTY